MSNLQIADSKVRILSLAGNQKIDYLQQVKRLTVGNTINEYVNPNTLELTLASLGVDSENNAPNTFIGYEDDFSEDTLSNYTYTDTGGGQSISYDSSNQWLNFNGADNESQYLDYTISTTLTTGIFRARIQKTGDYPSDNNNGIRLYNSVTGTSDNNYYVIFNGGAYTSSITKTYGGSSESQNMSYDFDDQSKFYTFEVRFSPTEISFYVDDVLQSSFTTSDTNAIDVDSVQIITSQFNGRLNLIHFSEDGTISQNTIGYTDLSSQNLVELTYFYDSGFTLPKPVFDIERVTAQTTYLNTAVDDFRTTVRVDSNLSEYSLESDFGLTLTNTRTIPSDVSGGGGGGGVVVESGPTQTWY